MNPVLQEAGGIGYEKLIPEVSVGMPAGFVHEKLILEMSDDA